MIGHQLAVKRQRRHRPSTHIHTHRHKPRERNQPHLKFLVIVLTWAGLMDSPAVVLYLPGMAIPGKILATKAISVQRLSFTVFFYPLGRAQALGLFQKSCMSSKSCNVAVNVLLHFILSFHFCASESYKQLFLALGLPGLWNSSVPQWASLRLGQELCTA